MAKHLTTGNQSPSSLGSLKKTIKLDFDFTLHGKLWAVSSSQKAYQFAFWLGKACSVQFELGKEIELSVPKDLRFLNYIWKDDFHLFRIFRNQGYSKDGKSKIGFLFPELSQFDFLIYLESEFEEKYDSFGRAISDIKNINLITEFDPNRFKNKDLLVTDL